jgi:hypothetical protein
VLNAQGRKTETIVYGPITEQRVQRIITDQKVKELCHVILRASLHNNGSVTKENRHYCVSIRFSLC